MKKIILLAFAIATASLISSCKKAADTTPAIPTATSSINDIKVPGGFTWETSRTLNFTVTLTDARFGGAAHVISIYDGDPYNGGNLITSGSATLTAPFVTKLYLSSQITQVYVVKTSPDKSSIVQVIAVGTADVNLSIGATDPKAVSTQSPRALGAPVSPNCTSGCTVTITQSTNNLNVNSGDVVCITGSNITVGFSNVGGGTIRVCGTNVTLQNINLSNSANLIITTNGSVILSSFNNNSTGATVQNFGTITASGAFASGGIFDNQGVFTGSGDFNINSGSTFTNNGSMTVSGAMNVGTSNPSANNGSITTTGNFTTNAGSAFTNNCSINSRGDFNNNGATKNYNLIKAAGTSFINAGSTLTLYNGAMLEAGSMIMNSTITGSGSTSLVKISGSTLINSGASVQNAVQYCAGGTFTNNGTFTGGAAQGCSVYIATSGCNADGNGTPAVVDSDGDGVPDNLDAYPNDATKAYNSYYPSSSTTATVAFEDLWPSKGDYDMNDVVVGYQYKIVTNASNVVVQVNATYTLMATGGTLPNGFAVQFPTTYASVSGITGGTLESGQSKAVIIVFANSRTEMANWNTQPGVTQTTAKTYTVSFNVANGPTISTFGLGSYNPFIYNYGHAREVHLLGQAPTDLADKALLGTQDDNSSVAAGRYYVTKTGLPFAITIPTSPFNYPVEGIDITNAYLHFSDWALAGGGSYTDWYSNLATGYRNSAFIYTH